MVDLDLTQFVGQSIVLTTTDGRTYRGEAIGYTPGLEAASGEDELDVSMRKGSCIGFSRSEIARIILQN